MKTQLFIVSERFICCGLRSYEFVLDTIQMLFRKNQSNEIEKCPVNEA